MAVGERLFHILEAQQFSREFLEVELFPHARTMEGIVERGGTDILKGYSICVVFYEPSTRTRESFERALR